MALNVMRLVHEALPSGELFFLEEEVTRVRRTPSQNVVRQISQSGSVSLVYASACWSIFTVTMNMFYRNTIEKLDMMRMAQSDSAGRITFTLWPYYYYDTFSSYPVLWTNVAEFFEQHVHGRIEGCFDQTLILEEVVTGACVFQS